MNSFEIESFFKIPYIIDNIYKELKIKEQLEYEKSLPVPNLREFFEMTQKKEEIPVPNLREFFEMTQKKEEIPVPNLREFFELANKKIDNSKKYFSKSIISNITYKNGHKIEKIEEKINQNGKEKIIKKCFIDDKDEKGKKYDNKYKKLLYHPLYNNIFDDLLNYRNIYKTNDLFLLPSHKLLFL